MRTTRTFGRAAIATPLILAGCQRAPSVDVLGSFFPIWIFCITGGILLTLMARLLLARTKLDADMGPAAIIYPSLAALFSCALWLVFFRD